MERIKLVTVDSKNKVRLVELYWEVIPEGYCIKKETGVWNGKMLLQPVHNITKGKVKRTVEQQRDLEFNSMLKKYLDKGYKKLDELELPDNYTENDIIKLIGSATDAKGAPKPMLCKKYTDINPAELNKTWLGSVKLDGCRIAVYMKNGIVQTSSRGGQDYNIASTYILESEDVKKVFAKYPDIILDGEVYRHGWNLQKISGLCRLENTCDDHKELCLMCYDIIDESKTFEERLVILNDLETIVGDKIKIVKHIRVSGLDNMMKLHNDYVAQGYEGLVLRKPDAKYKQGSRSNMVKIKCFSDDEFEITGITNGLRDEDFVFNLLTHEGKPFEAKPMGTREQRQEYRDNIDKLIGQKGTVKYFGFTPDGKPNLPIFVAVRNSKDI